MWHRIKRASVGLVAASVLAASVASPLQASELRFTFRNPSFGGNPFLGDFLIQGAQLENQFAGNDGGGGGGGTGGGGGGGDDGLANPFSNFQLPDPDDFSTGTTVIIGAPTN